jgi:hypothetical protein
MPSALPMCVISSATTCGPAGAKWERAEWERAKWE